MLGRALPRATVKSFMICNSNRFVYLDIFPIKSSNFYTDYVLSLINFTAIYWFLRYMALASTKLVKQTKFLNPSSDSDILQNVLGFSLVHATYCGNLLMSRRTNKTLLVKVIRTLIKILISGFLQMFLQYQNQTNSVH